jgi:hypothetical protein
MDVAVREVAALGLDPEKFRAFYEEALPGIYGYFLHRCGGSVPVAEDLTQETFLASVDELKRGRRPEAPIPWIYGIARHKLLDHYRMQARAEQPLADAALALDDSAFPGQDKGEEPDEGEVGRCSRRRDVRVPGRPEVPARPRGATCPSPPRAMLRPTPSPRASPSREFPALDARRWRGDSEFDERLLLRGRLPVAARDRDRNGYPGYKGGPQGGHRLQGVCFQENQSPR